MLTRLDLRAGLAAAVVFLLVVAWCPMAPAQEQVDTASSELASEPLVTNVFFDTDIRAALQDIASQTHVNIIPDETVMGTVSADLENVPLEKAISMVLMAGGYHYKKIAPDCYLVGACRPDDPNFNLLSETERIPLNHLNAKTATELPLSDYFEPYIKVDPQSHTAIVTGPRDIIDRIKADLGCVDCPSRVILIEAIVTDIQTDKAAELGVDWSYTKGIAQPEGTESISFQGLTMGYARLEMREVLLALRYLLTKGIAKIRAQPRITALDGSEAEIFVGREEYFSILAGGSITYPYYRLESIKSGISLHIRPHVTTDDEIILDFTPEVSDVVGKGQGGLPVVNRRRVKTTVRVKDGETVVIGGLASELLRQTKIKVPILGDLPLVGFLFTRSSELVEKTDITVLLTPRILRTPPAPSGPASPPPGAELGSAEQQPAVAPKEDEASSHPISPAAPDEAPKQEEPAEAPAVARAEPTTGAPACLILNPGPGEAITQGDQIKIGLSVGDLSGVSSVAVMLDGGLRSVLGAVPYETWWDTTRISAGQHTIGAVAHLTDGRQVRLPPTKIVVQAKE